MTNTTIKPTKVITKTFKCSRMNKEGSPCNKEFPQRKNLKQHEKTHDRPHTCYECIEHPSFAFKWNFNEHIKTIHLGKKPYECTFINEDLKPCDKKFTQKGSLNRHVDSAHKRITYSCNECIKQGKEVTFSSSDAFNKHTKRVHLELSGFSCKICNLTLAFGASRIKHINSQKHIKNQENFSLKNAAKILSSMK